ncbi:MAG: serine/threonine-protein phosphatase [Candidatus Hydrogenedens sp.]|nr:serine/threonine-protein phosphatase [Candidatus Hydrogenedens sp.]
MTDQAAFHLEFAGMSDVGRSRSRNEDSFNVGEDSGLALVCDGMGGHAGGDIASRTAAETIVDFIYEYEPDEPDDDDDDGDEERTVSETADLEPSVGRSIATIRAAVQLANRRLIALNQERGFPEGRGMGTTVVGLWMVEGTDKIVTFHAGDSRLYRLRGGELRQLTRDHSLYQAWLDSGGHGNPPHKNIIVRALGTMRDVEPEVSLQTVVADDIYLLCSDGLTSMLPDSTIAEIVGTSIAGELREACGRLIAQANEKGGHDNVTVVLARCAPAP